KIDRASFRDTDLGLTERLHDGGPRHGPPDCSSEGGYAPLGLPRPTLGRAPAQPWRASGPAYADSSNISDEVVRRPWAGERQLVPVTRQPRGRRARHLLETSETGRRQQECGVQHETRGAFDGILRPSPRVVRDTGERFERRLHVLPASRERFADRLLLLFLQDEKPGPGAHTGRRAPRAGDALSSRLDVVQMHAHAPFLAPRHAPHGTVDGGTHPSDVRDGALVGVEKREQL